MSKSIRGKIVITFLEKYPDMPTMTLAKMIYAQHPESFTTVQTVRMVIRYHRGKVGDKNLNRLKDKRFVNIEPKFRYNIPDSEQRDFSPFILSKSADNILILSDMHFPYHDPKAIEAALDWGVKHNINTILFNGDSIDFYQLSRYVKDPTARSFKYELDLFKEFLFGLREALPNVKIYFKIGNHEERYENYLKVKAPELYGIDEYKLKHLLRFGELGIECIGEKRVVKAGKLSILHGHEVQLTGGVNPARSLYLKVKRSTICGHLHRSSEHSETNIDGELFTTYSVGCLCDLHPEYAPYNNWNHGFANVKVNPDGSYKVFNARIFNHVVL